MTVDNSLGEGCRGTVEVLAVRVELVAKLVPVKILHLKFHEQPPPTKMARLINLPPAPKVLVRTALSWSFVYVMVFCRKPLAMMVAELSIWDCAQRVIVGSDGQGVNGLKFYQTKNISPTYLCTSFQIPYIIVHSKVWVDHGASDPIGVHHVHLESIGVQVGPHFQDIQAKPVLISWRQYAMWW